jgi:hypothetical protein
LPAAESFILAGTNQGAAVSMIDFEHCNCAEACRGYAHCVVVWIYDERICHGFCTDTAQAATRTGEHEAHARITLEHRVAVEMRDASLSDVASLIARIADARIYVPADRLEERRTLRLEDVSLATAVRELDLMAVDRPDP